MAEDDRPLAERTRTTPADLRAGADQIEHLAPVFAATMRRTADQMDAAEAEQDP